MSDHFVSFIPTNPHYVPPELAREAARQAIAARWGSKDGVTCEVSDEPTFYDCGENFEAVYCPLCGKAWTKEEWPAAMDAAYATNFQNLEITTPCCKKMVSMNLVDFRWPMGFARFGIQAMNPQLDRFLSPGDLAPFEKMLGCPLRVIYMHL